MTKSVWEHKPIKWMVGILLGLLILGMVFGSGFLAFTGLAEEDEYEIEIYEDVNKVDVDVLAGELNESTEYENRVYVGEDDFIDLDDYDETDYVNKSTITKSTEADEYELEFNHTIEELEEDTEYYLTIGIWETGNEDPNVYEEVEIFTGDGTIYYLEQSRASLTRLGYWLLDHGVMVFIVIGAGYSIAHYYRRR